MEAAPGWAAWAIATAPADRPLAECNPATFAWRHLLLDPDLGGVALDRARPARLVVASGSAPAGRVLPVRDPLPAGLAWHPHRPLVAGLAADGRGAHLWVADHSAGTVTHHERVRAVTSLTALGRTPAVAWCGDTLVVLVPAGRPAPPDTPAAQMFEATGPGFVTLDAAPAALLDVAAARVARIDTGTGAVTTVGDAGLVRGLRAGPGGQQLLLDVADDDGGTGGATLIDVATGAARPAPAGARWSVDADVLAVPGPGVVRFVPADADSAERTVPIGPDLPPGRWWPVWNGGSPVVVLAGRGGPRLVTTTGDRPLTSAGPVNVPAGPDIAAWTAGHLLLGGATPDRRHVVVRIDPSTATVVHTPAPATAPAPTAGPAVPSRGGPPVPVDPDGPLLLWIRAPQSGGPSGAPGDAPPGTLPALVAGVPAAVLDLALDWPGDATAAGLIDQVTGGVRDAVDLARRDGHRGAVVVGGHSFGATLALLALAHLPELAAAVAHSGCYNRTRTPGGFQFERRTYWQARDVYRAFSAFEFADRLDRPTLLVHGVLDTNPATPPQEATQLYRAIVAAGGHARLVLLPGEGHVVRHRESLATVRAEHAGWLRLAAAASRRLATTGATR